MRKNAIFFASTIVLVFWTGIVLGQNSVLSEGDWYKLSVSDYGIYQINYDDLESFGIDPDQVNPKHIRLYGNGSGMLPEANDAFRYDDLQEIAIFVHGEDDEVFDPGDFIVFYGEGPVTWYLNEESGSFEHEVNLYSDFTYYFLTTDLGVGKRIENADEPGDDPTHFVTNYNNYYGHQMEFENLIHSGKDWYGEKFEEDTNYDFDLNFPALILSEPILITSEFAARCSENSSMNISADGSIISYLTLPSVNQFSTKYAQKKSDTVSFYTSSQEFILGFEYNQPNDSAIAWLDYFELNFISEIDIIENYLKFRDVASAGEGNITKFYVGGADASTFVWNVTDPLNVSGVPGMIISGSYEFKIETDSLLEFIAFKGTEFPVPEFEGLVGNQNLHGLEPVDYLIISDELFSDAAQQLATFHESVEGFTWAIVSPLEIYNEYGSGAQDVSAIRDFIRDMYINSEETLPAYVLLFGDASYDYKDRIEGNTNYVPVFQEEESLITVTSICTDDFYTWMDEDEGISGFPDLSIGRLPVKTPDEADAIVQKILHYASSANTFGNWKNEMCFVADDADGNLHLNQVEELSSGISATNVSKLYIDFYEIINTPSGPESPEAEQVLHESIVEGLIYLNYTGHGSSEAWAQERLLELEDIEGWENYDHLPLIVAATGDFGRFDDPELISGSELAVLKEEGGAIGVISPGRITYANANFAYNQRLLEFLLDDENENKYLGDLHRQGKPQGNMTSKVWGLLGDPALKLSLPVHHVITDSINGIAILQLPDTIHPGQEIVVRGHLEDNEGSSVETFNGDLLIKVFERPYIRTTLANDSLHSYPADIVMQDSVILDLQTVVSNGTFEFSFVLPSDMNEEYGNIKLSYYAFDGNEDANGSFSGIAVGGQPSSVKEFPHDRFISLYPTITTDVVNFTLEQDVPSIKFAVIDLSGNLVKEQKYQQYKSGERGHLNLSNLKSGFYVVRAYFDNQVNHFKIIKQ